MACFNPVSHVIFDVDGLVLDTEPLYTELFQDMVSKYGKTFTWEVKVQMMGKVAHDAGAVLIRELDLPITIDEYIKYYDEQCKIYLAKAQLLPGVERLVRHLHKHNIPIAVATSSDPDDYQVKTTNSKDVFALFHHAVVGGRNPEVKRGKPAPDIFLLCASKFEDSPPPEKVLVFEDAPNGVEAALAAGMQVVQVPDPRVDPKLLERATLAIKSMEDFKPELFGLPPF